MGTIIVFIILSGCVFFAFRKMAYDKKNGKTIQCGGDCGNCGGCRS